MTNNFKRFPIDSKVRLTPDAVSRILIQYCYHLDTNTGTVLSTSPYFIGVRTDGDDGVWSFFDDELEPLKPTSLCLVL